MTNMKSPALKSECLSPGDCFAFKEMEHFGLILLTIEQHEHVIEHRFFPVLLDYVGQGLDKFINGQIFISSFIDFTVEDGKTEGFQVYHFMKDNPFIGFADDFIKIGNINLKEKYINVTGGTMARNMNDFRIQLNMFSNMFGSSARMTYLKEIIE